MISRLLRPNCGGSSSILGYSRRTAGLMVLNGTGKHQCAMPRAGTAYLRTHRWGITGQPARVLTSKHAELSSLYGQSEHIRLGQGVELSRSLLLSASMPPASRLR